MDQMDQLERQVRNLSLAVRLGVAVIIAAFALQAHFILARAPSFRVLFAELLEGKKLPDITRFFFNHSAFLSTGTIVVALLAIAALFVFQRKIWCIPVGLFIGIVCFAVTQLAGFAFQLPMVQILQCLSRGP